MRICVPEASSVRMTASRSPLGAWLPVAGISATSHSLAGGAPADTGVSYTADGDTTWSALTFDPALSYATR